jgi:hypothetical protein
MKHNEFTSRIGLAFNDDDENDSSKDNVDDDSVGDTKIVNNRLRWYLSSVCVCIFLER